VSEEEQDVPQAGAPEAEWKRNVHHFFTLQREPASNKHSRGLICIACRQHARSRRRNWVSNLHRTCEIWHRGKAVNFT